MPAAVIEFKIDQLDQAVRAVRELDQLQQRNPGDNRVHAGGGGPFSRVESARDRLAAFQVEGVAGAKLRDAELSVVRSQKAAERAERELGGGGASMEDRLIRALRSTRFGAGPAMPLAGQAADVLGLGGKGLLGLTIAAAAVGAFTSAVKVATEHLGELGNIGRLSGGGAHDVGFLSALGLSADDARRFRERITSDPMAMATAARLGIHELPRPFGDVNEARYLREGIEALRKIQDPTERLRTARSLDLDYALKWIDVSERTRARLDDLIAAEDKLADPKYSRSARDLGANLDILQRRWELLETRAGAPAIEGANTFLDKLQQQFGGGLSGDPKNWREAWSDIKHAWSHPWQAMQHANDPNWNNQGRGATDRHTAAMERHAQAMEDESRGILRPGVYGAGPRGTRAIHRSQVGDTLDRALMNQALRRGVISP